MTRWAREQTELPPPIFVLGLCRSGTTVLHRLLGQGPDNRTLPHWESFDPVHTVEGPEPRRRKLTRTLLLAEIVSPSIKAIHPMDAYQTDECRGDVYQRVPNAAVRRPISSAWLPRLATLAGCSNRLPSRLPSTAAARGERLTRRRTPSGTAFAWPSGRRTRRVPWRRPRSPAHLPPAAVADSMGA